MVAISSTPQRLAARSDQSDNGNGWGILQIATPAIVGGVLLLLFAAYIIWKRRPHEKRSYDYQQVRSEWVTKMERIFVLRRKRHQVVRSSAPVTLDDSMRTSALTFDFSRGSRQCRSNSSDSYTPLTSASYTFNFPSSKLPDYPPKGPSGSPPPIPKRPAVRWWWLFGSRPRQVKSEEPGQRWRVDDPDGCSTEHGHSSHGHRYMGALEPLREDPEDVEDEVIRIGENFTSVASTMMQHVPEQARFVPEMSTLPEQPSGTGATRSSIPAVSAQSNPGTTAPSVNRSLPPSYDVSQSISRHPLTEDNARLTHFGPYMALPPPVRAAGYPSPRAFHGRELSSDSFLASQPPMVASSAY